MKMLRILWADFPPRWNIVNPDNCQSFWFCLDVDFEAEPMDCAEGENFNPDGLNCDPNFECDEPTTEPPVTEDPTSEPPGEPITPPPVTTTTTPPDTTITTSPDTTTTTPPDTTTTTPRPPPPTNVCENVPNGRFINNPTHCRSYFLCMNEVPLPRQCDMGFNFNEQLQLCDRPTFTPCSNDDFECPFYGISRWEVLGSCTQYHYCYLGQHRLETCPAGLQFNTEMSFCALKGSFVCTRDLCPISSEIDDIVTYPVDGFCDRYYICLYGNIELEFCAEGTHWNQNTQRCEKPEDAQCELDTEPPSLIDCPVGEGFFFLPHPSICQNYFICHRGTSFEGRCADGLLFDSEDLQCVIADQARCAERSRQFTKRSAVFNYTKML